MMLKTINCPSWNEILAFLCLVHTFVPFPLTTERNHFLVCVIVKKNNLNLSSVCPLIHYKIAVLIDDKIALLVDQQHFDHFMGQFYHHKELTSLICLFIFD